MNQQVGDGEDFSQKSNYGRSVDEAKNLIKQLEAFKNTPTIAPATNNTTETTEDGSEKTAKNDVKLSDRLYTSFY